MKTLKYQKHHGMKNVTSLTEHLEENDNVKHENVKRKGSVQFNATKSTGGSQSKNSYKDMKQICSSDEREMCPHQNLQNRNIDDSQNKKLDENDSPQVDILNDWMKSVRKCLDCSSKQETDSNDDASQGSVESL